MAFDLEAAITTWKGFLQRRRAFLEEDLEELEGHMRDHIADLVRWGVTEEEAFNKARAQLGEFSQLEKSYREVFWHKLRHRKRLMEGLAGQASMVKNYLTLAFRNLKRHKGYNAVTISGLSLGLACGFFVYLWIQHELGVDRFHAHGDRLFQVAIQENTGDRSETWYNVPMPLASALESTYPEIEHTILTLPIRAALKRDEQISREEGYFVEPGFFESFSFPLLAGDPSRVLLDPSSIVISNAVATKYFGTDWMADGGIVGRTLSVDYWQSNGGVLGKAVTVNDPKDFIVAGVFEEVPRQSTLQFDFVLPMEQVAGQFPHVREWGPRWFELVVLLAPEIEKTAFEEKIKPVLRTYVEGVDQQEIVLQAFGDVYLYGADSGERAEMGRIRRVYAIGLIGTGILLIACINFTNIVTARSSQRVREIGVRKALGATPSYLVQQFLGEAMLTVLVAFFGALAILIVTLPFFNTLTGAGVELAGFSAREWGAFAVITLMTGIGAGSYPAFYLASQHAADVFRGQKSTRSRHEIGVRKALVVFQFCVSSFLIVGTATVYMQVTYMQTKDLGLDKENVVMLKLEGDMAARFDAVRQRLLQEPGIVDVSRSSAHPLGVSIRNANVFWHGKEAHDNVLFSVLQTDERFLHTMKLDLRAGRFFEAGRDAGGVQFVVNESAVKAMGLSEAIGHPFAFGYDEGGLERGQIIGVVRDFHMGSLRDEEIGPLAFRYEPEQAHFLLVRLAEGKTGEGLRALEQITASFNPGYLFDFAFLDESYQAYYEDESVLESLSRVFAFVSVFIACLGLFGLSAFSIQQRTREIGVRRILGASKKHVMVLLSLEFVKPVLVALALSLPVAYWVMRQWLASYAYHIELGPGIILAAIALSMAVALLAVGYQAVRAIRLDPVETLRQN